MRKSSRSLLTAVSVFLLISPTSFAFNSPLSEEAIREAYFLGQRRDESTARFLAKYKQSLPAPETGPQIASVELLTPFAQAVLESSQQTIGYSAQDAETQFRGSEESITMRIEVLLTVSYGPVIVQPTSRRSGAPVGFAFRSSDFWQGIGVEVKAGDEVVKPTNFSGEPKYVCISEGCRLTGATLWLDFPASAFHSNAATVEVIPPEGAQVVVDFDLATLR